MVRTRNKFLHAAGLVAIIFCGSATANTLPIGEPDLSTGTYSATYEAQKGESKAYAIAQAESMAKWKALDITNVHVTSIDTEGNTSDVNVPLNKKIIKSKVLAVNYSRCSNKTTMCATATLSIKRDNRSQLERQNAQLLAAINNEKSH